MKNAALVCIVVGLAVNPAWAAGTAQEQTACKPDVRRLCGKIGKGDDQKYRDCLQTHFSELSQKCQQVLMNHQGQQ